MATMSFRQEDDQSMIDELVFEVSEDQLEDELVFEVSEDQLEDELVFEVSEDQLEMGFDPYVGGYTYDC